MALWPSVEFRKWLRLTFFDECNIEDYGAVADGVTDCTAALLAALEAAALGARQSTSVYVPPRASGYIIRDPRILRGCALIYGKSGTGDSNYRGSHFVVPPGYSGLKFEVDPLTGQAATGTVLRDISVIPGGLALADVATVDMLGDAAYNGWTASTPVRAGSVMLPPVRNGYYYVARGVGVTGATPPDSWDLDVVQDGTATFDRLLITRGVTPFATNETLAVGDWRRPTMTGQNRALDSIGRGALYLVTVAGVTASEPTWGGGNGTPWWQDTDVIVSGTVTFRRVTDAVVVAVRSGASGFRAPQMIRIAGAGAKSTFTGFGTFAQATAGSPNFTVDTVQINAIPLQPGDWFDTPQGGNAPFPAQTMIASATTATHLVADVPAVAGTFADVPVRYYAEHLCEIMYVINGNTWIVSDRPFNAVAYHAANHNDCGIVARVKVSLQNVSVCFDGGTMPYGTGFGTGVAFIGSHGEFKYSNCNGWQVDGGCIFGNHHGYYCQGSDANSGQAINVNCLANGGWDITDASLIGNRWSGECASIMGVRTVSEVTNSLFDMYIEGGTSVSLSGYAEMRGTVPQDPGGFVSVDGTFNRRKIGFPQSKYQTSFDPSVAYAGYTSSASPGHTLEFKRTANWFAYVQDGRLNHGVPFLISDVNIPAPWPPFNDAISNTGGKLWIPAGHWVSPASNGAPNDVNRRWVMHDRAPPVDGSSSWGDLCWNTEPGPGKPAFWMCTTAGTNGPGGTSVWAGFAYLPG